MIRPLNIVNPYKQSLSVYPLTTTRNVVASCSYNVCAVYHASKRFGQALGGISQKPNIQVTMKLVVPLVPVHSFGNT